GHGPLVAAATFVPGRTEAFFEAEMSFRRCLDIREGAFSVTEEFLYLPHLHIAQRNLALLFRDRGDFDQAKKLLTDSIASMAGKLGKEHPDVLSCLDDLARVQLTRGEVRDAEAINSRCLQLWQNWNNTHHAAIAEATRTRALIDLAQGNPHKAAASIDSYSR